MIHGPLRFALAATTALALVAGFPAARGDTEPDKSAPTAQKPLGKDDLRRQEIELRKAAQDKQGDPAPHIALAKIYLQELNLPAAEAEARLARADKGSPDEVDPLLAQALSLTGKYTELFRDVKPGDRDNEAESQVRLTLGLAHLSLGEMNEAEPLLEAAEKFNPSAAMPKSAMAQLFLGRGDIAHAQDEITAARAIAPDDPMVSRVSARVLMAQGNTDGALKTLGDLLSKHPDDVPGLGVRANVLISANKLNEAQSDLDHALKLAPHLPGLIYLQALLLTRQGKYQDADTQLSTITTVFNDMPYAYFLQGVVKNQLGQLQQAQTALSKYIARVPNATPARRLLAQIEIRQRDFKAAINELKPVVDSNPSDTDSTALLAQAYLGTGSRRGDALDLYQRLTKLQPDNVKAAVALDVLKIDTGDVGGEGLKELNKMAQTAAGAATAGPALVTSELRVGHVSAAEQSAEALVDRNPQDSMAQSLLGTVRMDQGRFADAAAIFKSIADRDTTLLGARRGLVDAYVNLGKLDDAKAVLQGMLQQNPNSIVDAVSLARIEAGQKDEAAAESLLRKVQQGATTDPTPGLALLRIYGADKTWDKALSYGHVLELQFPSNPSVISTIAALHAAAGDPKAAAAKYGQLAQASPNDPNVLVRYSEYQSQAGDKTGARTTLENALSDNPKNFTIMSLLANFDFENGGFDKALATAQSFAPGEQLASDLISAGIYERAHRIDDAVTTLSAAMKRNPQLPVAIQLANDLFEKGERNQAVETLRAWIKNHPGDYEAQLVVAGLYDRLSDPASAQQAYEEALKNAPDNWVVVNNLAGIYAAKGDARARALGEQAYYLDPSPQTADTYGWALVRTGGAAEGLRLLRAANVGLPDNAVVSYHLAVALKETGDSAQARTILQKVIGSGAAFDDENAAKQLLEQLQHG